MQLLPTLNLLKGQCARIGQGSIETAVWYQTDPVRQAQLFKEAGATWLHIGDLDGARARSPQHLPTIEAIAKTTGLHLQVGGGIRKEEDVHALLSAGASRVVVGSLAVKDPSTVGQWITQRGGDTLALALDVRLGASGIPEVMTDGWQAGSALSLWDVLRAYKGSGLKTILCTDVQREGTLEGSNHDLYSKIRQIWAEADVIAAGGVKDIEDLKALADLGLYGALIGRALYEGSFPLQEALQKISAR